MASDGYCLDTKEEREWWRFGRVMSNTLIQLTPKEGAGIVLGLFLSF